MTCLLVLDLVPYRLMFWREYNFSNRKMSRWRQDVDISSVWNSDLCSLVWQSWEAVPVSQRGLRPVRSGEGQDQLAALDERSVVVSSFCAGSWRCCLDHVERSERGATLGSIFEAFLVTVLLFSLWGWEGRGFATEPQLAACCVNWSKSFTCRPFLISKMGIRTS